MAVTAYASWKIVGQPTGVSKYYGTAGKKTAKPKFLWNEAETDFPKGIMLKAGNSASG